MAKQEPVVSHYLATHTRDHVYREQLTVALSYAKGNVSQAAESLGLTRRAVYMAVRRFRLDLGAWR